MLTLLLDTSTERGLVAIADDWQIIYSVDLPVGLQNSRHLIPAISKGLDELNLAIKDFSLIAAGVGPGSYTGIRVGVAVAQGLAYPFSTPLVGMCTLAGFVPCEEGEFVSIIDARQGGVYLMHGVRYSTHIDRQQPSLHSLHEAERLCEGIRWLVTPNSQALSQRWNRDMLSSEACWIERHPDAGVMLSNARIEYEKGRRAVNGTLDLLYLKNWQPSENKSI